MLNYIWAFMILGGISYGLANGKAQALSDVIIESAGEAVSLSITMLGVGNVVWDYGSCKTGRSYG